MNKSIKVDKLSKKNKVAHQTPLVKVELEELSRVEPLEDPPQLEMNEIKKLKSKYWKKMSFQMGNVFISSASFRGHPIWCHKSSIF
ncbi:MAG: hypothetical protein RR817_10425 [Niameybacter sp.]